MTVATMTSGFNRRYALRSAGQRNAVNPGVQQYSPPRVTTKFGRLCSRRRHRKV